MATYTEFFTSWLALSLSSTTRRESVQVRSVSHGVTKLGRLWQASHIGRGKALVWDSIAVSRLSAGTGQEEKVEEDKI